MNAKENAFRIIHFDQPERIESSMPCYWINYHGVNHQGFDEDMEDGHDKPVGAKWYDIWNTQWHKEHPGVMGFPKVYPLAEMDSLENYEWPNPDDERISSKIYSKSKLFTEHENFFISGSHRDTLWEKSYMLIGMENMMMYFYTEPSYAKEILHEIMDFQLGIAKHYVAAGVEMVSLGDDLGTQSSLILSPQIINEFLIPEYRRIFNFYKEKNVIIKFHSCGCIAPLLDTFIELGVDILNPIQATANDLEAVIHKTNGRMALEGGVSTSIIMEGPVERIKDDVKKTIHVLGKSGGYFCAPDQWLPFPEKHVKAFYEAVEEYGKYPL